MFALVFSFIFPLLTLIKFYKRTLVFSSSFLHNCSTYFTKILPPKTPSPLERISFSILLHLLFPLVPIDHLDLMATPSSLRPITRHLTYYLPGADVFFLVDEVMFAVHRYFFERESLYFANLFKEQGAISPRQGRSHYHPISLHDVSPDKFAVFLWVFYNPKYSLYDTSQANWSIIEDYAIKWGFEEVRILAQNHLYNLMRTEEEESQVDPIAQSRLEEAIAILSADPAAQEALRIHYEDDHGL
jgi:hypothetical protein